MDHSQKSWKAEFVNDTVNVWPLNDVIPHTFDGDCICLPRLDPVEIADDEAIIGYDFMIVHDAWDGRE